MRILVIGDFHGKCSIPLKSTLKKEKIDLILSPGDYCGDERVAELFFKYMYDTDDDDVPDAIQKRIDKYEKEGIKAGFKVVRKLRDLKVPFLGIRGNWDPLDYKWDIVGGERDRDLRDAKRLIKLQREHFRFIDFKFVDAKDFMVIGGGSTTNPGKINKKTLQVVEELEGKKEVRARVKEYNQRKKKYEALFRRAKKKKKPVIFLTHNCPYQTKLDKIKKGSQKGKHYGSFLEKQIIKRFKPDLVICGHMHENQGKDKVGKSLIVNAGAVLDKKYAVIDFGEKIKVKFYK